MVSWRRIIHRVFNNSADQEGIEMVAGTTGCCHRHNVYERTASASDESMITPKDKEIEKSF
jgi:hypothetical protein